MLWLPRLQVLPLQIPVAKASNRSDVLLVGPPQEQVLAVLDLAKHKIVRVASIRVQPTKRINTETRIHKPGQDRTNQVGP